MVHNLNAFTVRSDGATSLANKEGEKGELQLPYATWNKGVISCIFFLDVAEAGVLSIIICDG